MKTYTSLLLFAVAFLLSVHSDGQSKFKKYFVTGSSQFFSGFLDGTIESISYHYEDGFKPRFKRIKINDQFWNPAISWKNKYKNGDCAAGPKFQGSTNVFAFTTDAYHLLRTTKRTIDGYTLAYYINDGYCNKQLTKKQKLKAAVRDFFILTAIRCAGFHLSYSFIFSKQYSQ